MTYVTQRNNCEYLLDCVIEIIRDRHVELFSQNEHITHDISHVRHIQPNTSHVRRIRPFHILCVVYVRSIFFNVHRNLCHY